MKKKQKAEPESRRKSSYKGNSRNNSKSGGLTFSEKKRLIQLKHILSGKSNEKEKPTTAQKTITFEKMFRDGICQVSHRYYTKMVEFFDINYELLEVDDQADILAQYSKLINYFDPSVKFELMLFNRQVNEQMLTEQFDIPWQEDDFNDIREEYTEMLKKQAAKGNNGIIKSKYLIFGVESNGYKEAKSRLNNIEKDVIRNFRRKPRKWNRQIWKQSRQNLERTIWMWLQISGQRQKNCFIVWTDRVQMILKRRYMRMCSRR